MNTKRFAVLGDPVAHSLSPRMHMAAYMALDLPHSYEAIRATPEDLPKLVEALRTGAFDGFQVTVPLKRTILQYADSVHPSAAAIGAANTLVRDPSGRIVAHNTDVAAIASEIRALDPARTDWSEANALVLGTGGAARAAITALHRHLRVEEVLVRGRSRTLEDMPVAVAPLAPSKDDAGLDIIVQCTSAGMTGAAPGDLLARAVNWSVVPKTAVVLEVIYAPPETPFLRAALARRLRSANGVGMLVAQGALAFELWLGTPAPRDAMLAALVRLPPVAPVDPASAALRFLPTVPPKR